MSFVPVIFNVSTLFNCGVAPTPVSEAVDKALSNYPKVRHIPFQCNPLEVKSFDDLQRPMDAFIHKISTIRHPKNGEPYQVMTDFITPLFHLIGVHLKTKLDSHVIDPEAPFAMRQIVTRHTLQAENIDIAARLIAQFLYAYRLPLFVWRLTKNLFVWPNLESLDNIPLSTMYFVSRVHVKNVSLTPIFYAQNFIMANFMDIYERIRDLYLDEAVPDDRNSLALRTRPDSAPMTRDEILWRCMFQLYGNFCPTHQIIIGMDYDTCEEYEDPEDIDASGIVKNFMEKI